MNAINEDILIQYINGTLAASPEHAKTLEQLFFVQELTKRIRMMNSVDPEKALQRFKAQVKKTNKKAQICQ